MRSRVSGTCSFGCMSTQSVHMIANLAEAVQCRGLHNRLLCAFLDKTKPRRVCIVRCTDACGIPRSETKSRAEVSTVEVLCESSFFLSKGFRDMHMCEMPCALKKVELLDGTHMSWYVRIVFTSVARALTD